MKKSTKKFLFFYSLIHTIAITSFLFESKIVFETHSLSSEQRKKQVELKQNLEAKARFEKEKRIREDWEWSSRVASKYLGRAVSLTPDDRNTLWFRRIAEELESKFKRNANKNDELYEIEQTAVIHISLLATNPYYDAGLGQGVVYFNEMYSPYKIDTIKRLFLFTNDDKKYDKEFWPFSKFKESYSTFTESKTHVFLGIFSGYDFSEFCVYLVIPLVILLISSFYKKIFN